MRNIGYLGIKLDANLYECEGMIDNLDLIRYKMLVAANLAEMTVTGKEFVKSSPHGVSGHLTLAESHMDISTWPEYRYVDIDIHSCGASSNADKAMVYLIRTFQPSDGCVRRMYTGVFDREINGLYLPPRKYPEISVYSIDDYMKFVET